MPSSPQTVPTTVVFDYEIGADGNPIANASVSVTLAINNATSISPVTNIDTRTQFVNTDTNGYWQFSLVPNSNISPSGTFYTLRTPNKTVDFQIGSGAGPFQSSGLLVSTPTPPAASNIGFPNPMTTLGDMIDATTGGVPQRLAVGSNNNVLTVVGGVPTWAANSGAAGNPITDQSNTNTVLTTDGASGNLTLHTRTINSAPAGFYFVTLTFYRVNVAAGEVEIKCSSSSGGGNAELQDIGTGQGTGGIHNTMSGVYNHTGGNLTVLINAADESVGTITFGVANDSRWGRQLTVVQLR